MKKEYDQIEFYKERSFASRLSATFAFIGENWKCILYFSLFFLLPVTLIFTWFFSQAFGQLFMTAEKGYFTPHSLGMFIGMSLFGLLLYLTIPSFYFALLQLYNKRENRLRHVKVGELSDKLKHNFVRLAWLTVFIIIIAFLIFWLALKIASPIWIGVIGVILGFSLGVPLLLLMPVYLMEDIPLRKAFVRSLRLGYKTWGGVLGMYVITNVIAGFINLLFAFPWLILTYVVSSFYATSETFVVPQTYQILIYFISLLMLSGSILSSILIYLGLAYQYAHASLIKKNIKFVDNLDEAEQSFSVVRGDEEKYKESDYFPKAEK